MAHKGARWTAEEYASMKQRRPEKKKKAPASGKPRLSEADLQHQVIQWFAWTYPEIYRTGALIAIPNSGKRGYGAIAQVKKEGIWKGASDLVLFWPAKGKHGLVLEMKADGGKVSPEQLEWLAYRKESGYAAHVAWSFEEATKIISDYVDV